MPTGNGGPSQPSGADGFSPLDEIFEAAQLQIAQAEQPTLGGVQAPAEEAAAAVTTVLVVDDDPSIRTVLCRQLERRGYRTFAAESAEVAWARIRMSIPHAIVTDVRMPGTNGIEFLSAVMDRHPDTVVIVTSGSPDMEMTLAALRAGAVDFLVKPMDFTKLLAALERGIERRRTRLEQRRYQLNLEQIISERTRRLVDSYEKLRQHSVAIGMAYRDAIVRLGRASEWRDDETGEHIQRIGVFSGEVARVLGLSKQEVELIREASPMHDIGKIGVPDSILLKPGRLTPLEFERMKAHTLIGAEILSGSEAPLMMASEEIAVSHHEWWNGAGYPFGKSHESISLLGRIVAVVDVYDALTHSRSYKKAIPLDEAINQMQSKRGKQFDPEVFDGFLESVDELVRLERAMATKPARSTTYDVEIGLLKMAKHVEETWQG